jgi:transcriptional regulator with XRE-family HTH domain
MREHEQEQVALGRAIRCLRQDRRLSTASLARKAGMSPGHLRVIERGQGNPRLTMLLALSEALGVTLTQIVLAAEEEAAR